MLALEPHGQTWADLVLTSEFARAQPGCPQSQAIDELPFAVSQYGLQSLFWGAVAQVQFGCAHGLSLGSPKDAPFRKIL